jgi:hypothetical protein
MFLGILFTIYHLIISYYRIKHIKNILKSDKLDVKNSPLDRLASLAAKALFCFKGACEAAPASAAVGLTLGLMLGADEIINSARFS